MEFPQVNTGPLAQWPETAYCIVSASHRFQKPPEALLAMMLHEAGRKGAKTQNTNGSLDLGPMQVNTIWLRNASPLSSYVNEDALANDLCLNIHSAAWILSSHYKKTKNIWAAIGMYHSPGNRVRAEAYMRLVNAQVPKARKIISHSPDYRRYLNTFYSQQTVQAPLRSN